MRGWALRLVLSLVPGEEARGVFEKWLFLPFVGWFFFGVVVAQVAARDGRPPSFSPSGTERWAPRVTDGAKLARRETASERRPRCGLNLTDRNRFFFVFLHLCGRGGGVE